MRYNFERGTYIGAHYEHHKFKSKPHDSTQRGYFMANIRLSRSLNFYTDCNYWDGLDRYYPDDPRDSPSGGATINATLIAKKFLKRFKGLELRGSVYNLFDKEYVTQQLPSLPSDLPMPGRNYMVEMKYKF